MNVTVRPYRTRPLHRRERPVAAVVARSVMGKPRCAKTVEPEDGNGAVISCHVRVYSGMTATRLVMRRRRVVCVWKPETLTVSCLTGLYRPTRVRQKNH